MTRTAPFKLVGGHWKTFDPFLFVAFHDDSYPKGSGGGKIDESKQGDWSMYHGNEGVPGFVRHPHCGFETITVVETGAVDHADNMGNHGRFKSGDVQWMTAGSGMQHSEMFPLVNENSDNPLVLFQIWLNLPAKSKEASPNYRMMWREQLSKVSKKGVLNITGLDPPPDSWAASKENFVVVQKVNINPGETHNFLEDKTIPSEVMRTSYIYSNGEVIVNKKMYSSGRIGFHTPAREPMSITATDTTVKFLVMQGRPIGEPVVHHGPFVASSSSDMRSKIQHYRDTEYGGWPWNADGPVFDVKKGRFMKYGNGDTDEQTDDVCTQ